MSYILTLPTLAASAKILSRAFELPVRYSAQVDPPTIRWGYGRNPYTVGDTQFNSPEAITTCSSKTRFSATMHKAGLKHVQVANDGTPEHYPVLVRTVSGGHGGQGIVVVENEVEWHDYRFYPWSYWQDFSWEIGVHVLGGEVVKVFKKIWDRPTDEPKYPIRNTDLGWRFSRRNPDTYDGVGLRDFVSQFYKAFPIEMCRLDIGRVPGGLCIIECNSAPALTANADTAQKYIDFLKARL